MVRFLATSAALALCLHSPIALSQEAPEPGPAVTAQSDSDPGALVITNESIELASLPNAPPGVLSAVLSGDLSKPGLYVLRNKWEPNTWLRPHTHGQAERIYTVMDGEVMWGFGETVDESRMVRLGRGSVVVTRPGMAPHYFRTGPAGVVFNVVAEGPFITNFVDE